MDDQASCRKCEVLARETSEFFDRKRMVVTAIPLVVSFIGTIIGVFILDLGLWWYGVGGAALLHLVMVYWTDKELGKLNDAFRAHMGEHIEERDKKWGREIT